MNQTLYEQLLNSAMMLLHREKMNKKIKECQREIQNYNANLDVIAQKIYRKPDGYYAKKGWGIFFLILCLVGNISLFSSGIDIRLCILLAIIWNTILIALACSFLLLAQKSRKKYDSATQREYETTKQEIIDPAIKKNNEKIKKIEEDLAWFWELHKSLIEFLPEKYQTLDAVAFMLESVKNLRANTLTDVINLYEEECRWRITQATITQQAMLQQLQSQRLNDTLREIEQNQQNLHSDLQSIQTMQLFDMIKR